jgi:YegS/Rv2252/BmrU family lipid kinase
VLRRRVLVIVNPAAGGWRRAGRLARLVAALRHRGCDVEVRHAEPADGETERLAREAAPDVDVIVGAGGDGTLNAIANGIAGSATPFAVLPLGTANVLAREIGLPRQAERQAELIAAGTARPVWPGQVGDRLFLTTASSGFDARVVTTVNLRLKRRVGRLAFAWAIAVGLRRYRADDIRVVIDGTVYRAANVIAAKGRRYAGSFIIAAEADLAEPLLHFLLLQRAGRLAMLCYLAALSLGRISLRRDIIVLRARDAVVSAGEPVPVQADGEIVGHLPARFAVASQPLLLIRP